MDGDPDAALLAAERLFAPTGEDELFGDAWTALGPTAFADDAIVAVEMAGESDATDGSLAVGPESAGRVALSAGAEDGTVFGTKLWSYCSVSRSRLPPKKPSKRTAGTSSINPPVAQLFEETPRNETPRLLSP